jgi:methyl-accepting chemotaxis protein
MGLLDTALAPLRAILGSAEQEAEQAFPVQDIEGIQLRVLETVEAIRDATEQIEAHVSMLEKLANSITPLTESVEKLTAQLGVITEVITPVAAAERDVAAAEHDVARVGRLFARHRREADSTAAPSPEEKPTQVHEPDRP